MMMYGTPPIARSPLLALVWIFTAAAVPAGLAAAPAAEEAAVVLLPHQLILSGGEASHRLLPQIRLDGQLRGQPDGSLQWSSRDPKIASVQDGVVRPVENGTTTVTVRTADGQSASASVTVKDIEKPHRWSFRNHVLPVMAKAGCNSGACHGALSGKGGFKLSLRGYDSHTDYDTITRQARGRRIELSDPGRSLLLAKPSGGIPHQGGLRFDVDSRSYRVLAEWIAAGAAPPAAEDPQLEQLEVLPSLTVLQPGREQQVVVRAHYSDGRVEDVTEWAKFASTNETVANVSDQGVVQVIGHGEGAVTAWFSQKIVIARISSPFANEVEPAVFQEAPRRNFIDDLVLEQLQRLNLPPSPPASDETFIRRAFLDTIGTLPTVDEVAAFRQDPAVDKRDRLIEDLLARPEFVDYWTYKWSDILLLNGTKLRPEAVKAYYEWIHANVKSNTPWDEFVRQVVTARGSSLDDGATNFYALHQDPESMMENVCQAFLGLSIGCAKCHNHPLEKWTNDQYYGMANMFSRVRAKGWGGDSRNGDGLRTLYVVPHGELVQPLTGKPQPPRPLDGAALPFDATRDRRIELAQWLTAPENPYFARSITNRIWANYFGLGLVEPVDDMRDSNPASNDQLLNAAADYLVANQFDLKQLMRAILQSETYQRSSLPLPHNVEEKRFYSRYYPRRLMAEVLLDAVSHVTQTPSTFDQIVFPGADKRKTDFYPRGTRAIQLYDSAVESYFLQTFGRNTRRITCECERSDEPSMVQVLHIANGDTINQKLREEEGRVSQWAASQRPAEEMLAEAFLLCLARQPTDEERKQLLPILQSVPAEDPQARRVVLEDLFWALLSSREFLFNH